MLHVARQRVARTVSLALLALVASAQAAPSSHVDIDTGEGESLYLANCASCHLASGEGVPGVFPPLVRHVPNLEAAEGGRAYLINMMLYGVQGEIEVLGERYNGVMPGWRGLSDEAIADLLNYISVAWGNAERLPEGFEAYTPDEVAAQREPELGMREVYEQRLALEVPQD
ncbi:c-type cytochrome [Truepera radiovictrix]|uniref:Cytochrome c class I n=1 Tax=Truepera radiovictrix (strain DSM 17093 / CIP 108686 / LMG 22925 / RQ-24) TaxID=649638 RepID=D7CQN2_TRURR|nr:cytochrome c [Truepera radiovictrix]ADI15016.1 cytochrome c class I [Truepera radiovictrix DSM 17093]WMT56431.1 cytochrome c [Truepera radiovictrix]